MIVFATVADEAKFDVLPEAGDVPELPVYSYDEDTRLFGVRVIDLETILDVSPVEDEKESC